MSATKILHATPCCCVDPSCGEIESRLVVVRDDDGLYAVEQEDRWSDGPEAVTNRTPVRSFEGLAEAIEWADADWAGLLASL